MTIATTRSTTTSPTLAPATYELERQLRTLRVSGMAQTLLARNQEAIANNLAYTEFLMLLVALGLVVFGIYGLCEARWRKV